MVEEYTKTIAKGAGIFFIGIILAKFFSYFFRILVARGLGAETYGIVSLAIVVYSVGAVISLFGLPTAIERYVSFHRKKNELAQLKGIIVSSVQISIPVSILLALAIYLSSERLAIIFGNISMAPIFAIFGLIIPFYCIINIFAAVARAFENIEYPVYVQNVIVQFLILVFSAVAIYLGYGVIGVAYSYLLAFIFAATVMFVLVESKIFSILNTKLKSVLAKKRVILYSWPLVLAALLALIIGWTDTVMLGIFKSEYVVGLYNTALPTAGLLLIVPSAVISLVLPILSGLLAKNKHNDIANTLKTTTKWIFYVNFPLALLMIFFPQQILRILFGQEFTIAFLPLSILAVGFFANSMTLPSMKVIDLFEKTKYHLFNNAIVVVINIILNYLLIPRYELVGAAIASAVSFLILATLVTFQVGRLQKSKTFSIGILRSCIVSIVLIIAVYLLSKKVFGVVSHIAALILFIGYLICYFLCLYFLRIIKEEEIEIINLILKKAGFKFKIKPL